MKQNVTNESEVVKMKKVEIIKSEVSGYSHIIYADSYINPLLNIDSLTEKLLTKNVQACNILVDLLLSNGENYNRFAKAYFNGKSIERNSLEVVELDEISVKKVNGYYSKNKKIISKGVLVESQYMKYARG